MARPNTNRPTRPIRMRPKQAGAGHPLIDFSAVSRLFKLAIFVACAIILARLAFVWSLGETEKLTTYAIGAEYGRQAAWLIQLLPQVLLIIRVTIVGKWYRAGLLAAALLINFVDAGTNIAAFLASERVASGELVEFPFMQTVALAVGITLAFLITWAEELLAWMLGSMLDMVARFFPKPPRWMLIGEQFAKGAAGMPSATIHPGMLAAMQQPTNAEQRPSDMPVTEPVREAHARVFYAADGSRARHYN